MISVLCMVLLSTWCIPLADPPSERSLAQQGGQRVLLQFEAQPLIRVVKWMSKKTGRNFIVKDELRTHPITIVSSSKVTVHEAYQAFLEALQTEGLEAVETGKFVKIVRGVPPAGRPRDSTLSARRRDSCGPVTGVSQVDDHTWLIQRDEFHKRMAEMDCLARQARIVPSIKDGKPRGFKLFAIRSASLYARLGLKNGDLILKLNGHEITTPDKALEAYTSLKSADTIEVQLERRGKPRTHTYLIKK